MGTLVGHLSSMFACSKLLLVSFMRSYSFDRVQVRSNCACPGKSNVSSLRTQILALMCTGTPFLHSAFFLCCALARVRCIFRPQGRAEGCARGRLRGFGSFLVSMTS